MPSRSRPKAELRPLVRYWAAVGLLAATSITLAAFHYASTLPPGGLVPVALGQQATGVKVSDLLSICISVSGVTVPILVAYMLLKAKDLQLAISERTELHLKQNGHSVGTYRSACLFLTDQTNTFKASELLECFDEFLSLGSHEADESLTLKAQQWLFPSKGMKEVYNGCFANGRDRRVTLRCIVVTGVCAIACFVDMYARFYGFVGVTLDTFEQVLVPMTGMINVLSYVVLVWLISKKADVREEAFRQAKLICAQISTEIEVAVNQSKQQERSMVADLKQGVALATTSNSNVTGGASDTAGPV